MQADIVIVGGGLAGLSAATEVAIHSRASIVIVEHHGLGSNRTTPMTFADVPGRFGLEDCVIGRYRRFSFHSPLGNRSTHAFETVPLVALAYRQACETLFKRASSAGHVSVVSATASRLVRHDRRWRMALSDGQVLDTPLVIDASGRGLFASRVFGLEQPKEYSHCYGVRLSQCRVPDPDEAIFLAPCRVYGSGGGWLYPLDGNQASFGYATLGRTPVWPGDVVKANLKRALTEFEPYAAWLKGAVQEQIETGTIPIYPLRRFVYDGLLIAGDAAGQATIWSCMGSEAALTAGQLAGEAAVHALRSGDFGVRTLSLYQANWDQCYRRTYQHNAWISPVVWSMSEEEWNQQIPLTQKLTPDQMVARLRTNWPVPTMTQAVFVRAYDVAGRARRGLMRRLRAGLSFQHTGAKPAKRSED